MDLVIMPEMGVLVVALLLLFIPRFFKFFFCLGLLLVLGLLYGMSVDLFPDLTLNYGDYFFDHFRVDAFALSAKMGLLSLVLCAVLYGDTKAYEQDKRAGEYYCLLLLSTLGMMTLISSASLLSLYLGLELFSLPLYALIAFDREDKKGIEAAFKFFVLGSLASAIFLYGLSIIYGVTGTVTFQGLSVLDVEAFFYLPLMVAFLCLSVGLCFKAALVPFHYWIADTYQGSSLNVIIFLAAASPLAAFALMLRLWVQGLPMAYLLWKPLALLLAFLCLILGNTVALVQTLTRRMLAYSAVAHMSFLVLGLTSGDLSQNAAFYYTMVYALMTLLFLGALGLLAQKEGREYTQIADFKGLVYVHPGMAVVLLLALCSMAGLPPLLGFFAKMTVLMQALNFWGATVAAVWIAFSVIAAVYYLNLVRMIFFEDKPLENAPAVLAPVLSAPSLLKTGLLYVHTALFVFLGLYPGLFLDYCQAIFPL